MEKEKKSNIVPFGKYKGQPLEAMAQDRQYVDWLMAQDWFREKYANYYTIVVNNFTEPNETPEHNAAQAEFLDDKFCKAFARATVMPLSRLQEMVQKQMPEWSGPLPEMEIRTREFEVHGWDARLYVSWQIRKGKEWSFWVDRDCYVEIKPAMGDDYPAVLRQMKAARKNVYGAETRLILLVGAYSGIGANLAQARKIFETSGIQVILRSQIGD